MKTLSLLALLLSGSAFANEMCADSYRNQKDVIALEVVAKAMKYTVDELCSHPRVMDFYFADRIFYRVENNNEPEPHTWVTIHYNEYSCQYFVRDLDLVITSKNCYNTW